jgi:hypothetical protein
MTPFEKLKLAPIDALAARFASLRSARAEAKAAYEAADAPLVEAMALLERVLLAKLHDNGASSVKTNHGTVYIYPKKTATIVDFDALWEHIRNNDTPEMLQRRVTLSEVEAYNELHADAPVPGLVIETTQEARLRAK